MNGLPNRDVEVFTEAINLPAGERAAFLDKVCEGDAKLRQQVETLLQTHDRVGDFLEESPQKTAMDARSGTAADARAGDRIGRYKLLQQIGEGGCGIVFKAEQEEPMRRSVALKVIKPGMDTKSVIARFEVEQQALALMDHPNIAKVFDAGTTESGRPYFVMELVRGTKITQYCDQNSLTTEERLKLFIQVCQAVQHAHQKGIIHRDIKPSNILVTTTAEDVALPVVIDFGIAKATSNQRLTDKTYFTALEMLIGTPAYMSPEQAELTSVDVDTRTDIYSLGVLLYELLTGSPPFDTAELSKAGLDEIRRVIREQEPGRPSTRLRKMTDADLTVLAKNHKSEPPTLIRTIRGDLDWIVMKALEKDRKRRYATAHGLVLDVQSYLAKEPILARPPSNLYKLQKMVLRNKLLFAGISIFTLLLVVSLIVVSTSLAKERRSRREAEAAEAKAESASVKSQQVTEFLESMLNGVGPSVALGRDTTILREILDRTSERIGTEMTNQPAVAAELYGLIGHIYGQIGYAVRAEGMHRAALAINEKLFGAESKEVAASLNSLGLDLQAEGKRAEAEKVDEEALTLRRQLLGNENADTATSLNDLSGMYRDDGRLKEAEAMARKALGIRQKLFANESLEVADSLRNISIILGDEGQWPEADTTAREVLAIRRNLLGSEHPWVASALMDAAWAAGGNGKKDEAETMEREALAIRQKILPADHPDVALSLYAVGDRMRQQGKLNEAYPVLNAALSIQTKLLGDKDPASLETLRSMGLTLQAESKWSDAEVVFRELLAAWRKRAGNEDQHTLYALHDFGATLDAQRKWTEAEIVRREELTVWRNREGGENSHTLYTMHCLAVELEGEGKWAEAETVHGEALAAWRKLAGNEDPQTLYALRNLGATLEGEGKWPEAEVAYREELASWRNRVGSENSDTLYTLGKLGKTLEQESKWPDAEIVYRETLATLRKQAGGEDSRTLSEWENLARVLNAQKKFGDAEKLVNEALTPAFARQPASANLLALRVELEARRGQWQEAAADAGLALEYQPANPRYAMVTALFLKTHNRPAYERLCKRLITSYANTTDIYIADQVAKSCLFLPSSEVDLKVVGHLADTAVKNGAGDTGAMPFFEDCKALSEYRLGHYAEAAEWAQKPLKIPGVYVHGHAYATLAMAYWQLGEKDRARAMLAKGNTLEPNVMPVSIMEDPSNAWLAWLFARIQLDEAAALIQPGSATDNTLNQP